MRRNGVRLGSISLLFTVVVLCVVTLSVLSVATALADRAVTEKYADRVTEVCSVENEGQEWLARLDGALSGWNGTDQTALAAALPEDAVLGEDGTISAELTEGDRTLKITARPTPGGAERYEVLTWSLTTQWSEDTSIGTLLGGN